MKQILDLPVSSIQNIEWHDHRKEANLQQIIIMMHSHQSPLSSFLVGGFLQRPSHMNRSTALQRWDQKKFRWLQCKLNNFGRSEHDNQYWVPNDGKKPSWKQLLCLHPQYHFIVKNKGSHSSREITIEWFNALPMCRRYSSSTQELPRPL